MTYWAGISRSRFGDRNTSRSPLRSASLDSREVLRKPFHLSGLSTQQQFEPNSITPEMSAEPRVYFALRNNSIRSTRLNNASESFNCNVSKLSLIGCQHQPLCGHIPSRGCASLH